MKIGFVTCVHPYYDLPAVAARREQAVAELRSAGFEVVLTVTPLNPDDAVRTGLQLKDGGVDAVLLFFCTWVAEAITLALARELAEVPMVLWALPFLDRDVPMPSPMSGITSTASNIRRIGKRFAWVIGGVEPEVLEQVMGALRAGGAAGALRHARFGLVGAPCPGMLDVEADEGALFTILGVTAVHYELNALLESAQTVESGELAAAAAHLTACAGGGVEIAPGVLAENLRMYAGIKQLVRGNRLDAYCVRCWPELRDQRMMTPCVAHALMAQEGIASTCEVDLPALITVYVLSHLAGAPAFNFDITGYLEDRDAIQFGHCGAADPRLAPACEAVRLRSHMRTGTGATIEFPFREGAVTLAKLMRPANGKMKLFAARGVAMAPGSAARGSVAEVRPEPSAAAFLETMMEEGVEHHVALVYGTWTRELRQFCKLTGVEYLPISGAEGTADRS
jgi:L-fucose isomerase-like protein